MTRIFYEYIYILMFFCLLMEHEEITGEVIRVFYKVYNALGYGFLEKVYENALAIEFSDLGMSYVSQKPISVLYNGKVVGNYVADFIIDGKVIVEVKAIRELSGADEKQLLNYLRTTDINVGLVLNFGASPEFKRKVVGYEDKKVKECWEIGTRMNAD